MKQLFLIILLLLGLTQVAFAQNPQYIQVSGGGDGTNLVAGQSNTPSNPYSVNIPENGIYILQADKGNGAFYIPQGTNTTNPTYGVALIPVYGHWDLVFRADYTHGSNADNSGYSHISYQGPSTSSPPTGTYSIPGGGSSDGSPSPAPTVAVYNQSAPLQASSVTFGSVTPVAITINWTAANQGVTPYTYQVQRAPDNAGAPGAFVNAGPQTSGFSYTDTGLSVGTVYWYRVVVTDSESPAVSAPGAAQFNVTLLDNPAAFTATIPVRSLPTAAGDLVTVPAGAVIAGSNPVASISLYAGTTSGGEGASPVATINTPAFPVTFPAQPRPTASAPIFYVVKTSDGYIPSLLSNEIKSAATAIAGTGNILPQTFTASYGPAYSGLAIGYTVYDPTGAVIMLHTTAGVGEIPGSGIYSASVPLDAADYGSFVWDAPAGAAPIVQSFSVPAAGGGGGGASAAAVVAAIKADPVMSRTFNRSKQLYTYNVTTHVMTLLNDDGSPFASITLGYDNATGYPVSRH